MKTAMRIMFGFFMICVISRNGILFAQTSEPNNNLEACKSGFQSCDRTLLTDQQSDELRSDTHRRTVADCRAGIGLCNQSALTEPETIALAIANHQSILNGVVVIAVVLWLLNVFGLFHSLSRIHVGT
jgi:hypothetical protein